MVRFPGRSVRLAAVLVVAACVAPAARSQTITFNFNSGNDTGFTRYDPLSGVGNPATFSFPNGNSYRIQSTTTVATFGAARAGSFRQDATYSTNFYVASDVIAWNNSLNQFFGLGGRITTPGLTTTNGYLFSYGPSAGVFQISRVTGESPTTVGTPQIFALDPSHQYRFAFSGSGSNLTGQAFDLAAPTVPVVTVTATDATYASGFSGLVVASSGSIGSADATFDNYFSAVVVPEPGTLALTGLAIGAFGVRRWRGRR